MASLRYNVVIQKGIASFTSLGLKQRYAFRCGDIISVSASSNSWISSSEFDPLSGFNPTIYSAYSLTMELTYSPKMPRVFSIVTKGEEHLEIMESLLKGTDYPPAELA